MNIEMDGLEKFVKRNREAFDGENPNPEIWQRIEERLPDRQVKSRRIGMWQAIAAAAVVLVLIMSGVIAGLMMSRNAPSQVYTEQFEEFRRAEQYYNIQLREKVNELEKYAYDQSVESDLNELEQVYRELSQELEDGMHPNQSDLIQALILNYQTRIDLLEKVLNRLEESQKQIELTEADDENIKI